MLFQCWASVIDTGPTLKQHWVNASRLLGQLYPGNPLPGKTVVTDPETTEKRVSTHRRINAGPAS